jgi:shikimate dehydrogenase
MIGSVNTLVNKNGTITGDNTDAPGFFRAITGSTDTRGKNIALFGAGGAGRAILFSLFYYSEPSRVFLTDSIKERSDELKDNITGKFHGRAGIKEAVSIFRMKDWPVLKNSVDIIINATPGGMEPEINTSILEESSIPERIVLMDIVYHPHETLLIRSARNRGCRIVYGAEMLLYQGVLQFEIWTGREAPVEVMRKALLDKIYESEGLK